MPKPRSVVGALVPFSKIKPESGPVPMAIGLTDSALELLHGVKEGRLPALYLESAEWRLLDALKHLKEARKNSFRNT